MNYFSLDVEGSEFQILKTIPFQDVDIKVIDIEIDRAGTIFPGTYEDISKYLDTQGYDFHSQITKYDAVFVKKGFLDEINELWSWPSTVRLFKSALISGNFESTTKLKNKKKLHFSMI